jgi:hypothetical protein
MSGARQSLSELGAELRAKWGPLLASPEGGKLIERLEELFFEGDLLGATPEETAFNLGAREVVRRLRDARALQRKLNGG